MMGYAGGCVPRRRLVAAPAMTACHFIAGRDGEGERTVERSRIGGGMVAGMSRCHRAGHALMRRRAGICG